MSANLQEAKPQDTKPQDDMVNVEVDGKPVKARKGAMIIHVTDAHNAYVPRFCYHDKLPIAANCRMCLVEVEKAPKPQPACATPVAEGMKIFTKSVVALGAQKATMEFLLINHPLDCPICDQGGECELQDLALGFGRDASRFHERKRVVKDKNLGSLVSTDMTRCIHCTRCVRFGQDVAGIQELGTTGRGEHMEIGTFIEKSVDHELSGNIIDLCPVGALNSKPFRYQGRSWEMTQAALVAPHDGLGSNLFAHVLRGKLMRIVPRPNDAINETWISDRDRFSYEAIYSEDRLQKPMIREGDTWRAVDWETALKAAAEALRAASGELNVLAAPSSTTEELYLTQRLARGLGSNNIDHRLRQRDFRGQHADALHPSLGMSIVEVEQVSGALIVGSNLRRELPLLAHRLRKAARAGASIAFINPAQYEYLFPVAANIAAAPSAWLAELRGVLDAVRGSGSTSDSQRALASALTRGDKRTIWIGALALRAPHYAEVRELLVELAAEAKASLGELSEGANAAGAYLAGAIPHRQSAGRTLSGGVGRDTAAQLTGAKGTYL